MGLQLANFIRGRLAAAVTTSSTTLTLTAASFPTLAAGDYCFAVLQSAIDRSVCEIIKVTAVSGTSITVVRALEGTTARAFAVGDFCELRITAAQLQAYENHINTATLHAPAFVAADYNKYLTPSASGLVWQTLTPALVGSLALTGGALTGALTSNSSITAPSFVGPLSGNATTASTLQTARTITIGPTGKSFSGAANISWTAAEMAVVSLTGTETISGIKTFTGANTYSGVSKFSNEIQAYRTAYTDPDSGVTRAIKIGDSGMAVLGGIKTDSLAASGNVTASSFTGPLTGDVTGAVTGNASTATTLQTARTLTLGLTGKAFDGSANVSWTLAEIGALPLTGGTVTGTVTATAFAGPLTGAVTGNATTATTLQTARTLTLGLTGKTFNGSANVAWTLAEIGALPLTGGTVTGSITAPTFIGALTGNASTATTLQTSRTLSVSGDATGSAEFNGSANAAIALTLAASGVPAGTYRSVTVDAKGRVTAGTNPTTLAGYAISDAVPSSRTVNGLALSANITLDSATVGAEPSHGFVATGGAAQWFQIATLPVSNYGTYDTITLEGSWGAWAGNRYYFRVAATNRGGLQVRSMGEGSRCPIYFYSQTDGSVIVYAYLGSYQVIQSFVWGDQVSGVSKVGATVVSAPVGTLAWDGTASTSILYTTANKPTAADVGALPLTGGTVTGAVTIASTLTTNGLINNTGAGEHQIQVLSTDSGKSLYMYANSVAVGLYSVSAGAHILSWNAVNGGNVTHSQPSVFSSNVSVSGTLSVSGILHTDGNFQVGDNGDNHQLNANGTWYHQGAGTINGDVTLNANLYFGDSGTSKRGIEGTCGGNDFWFIGGVATASNAGYMEIATGDDGQTAGAAEPIYVSQYGPGDPLTGTLYRRAALLDANGNTSFPGTVTAPTITVSGNIQASTISATTFTGTLSGDFSNGIIRVSGQDFVIRDKRALVGETGVLHINYATDWANVSLNGLVTFTGNIFRFTDEKSYLGRDSTTGSMYLAARTGSRYVALECPVSPIWRNRTSDDSTYTDYGIVTTKGGYTIGGANLMTGVNSFSNEQHFYLGSYSDPVTGARAIKVGSGGIAVNGDSQFNNALAVYGIASINQVNVGSLSVTNGAVGACEIGGNGDGASNTVANLRLLSWYGIGFGSTIGGQTIPQYENAMFLNVRSGQLNVRGAIYGSDVYISSDARLKSNFATISDPVDKVKRLVGKLYDKLPFLTAPDTAKRREAGLIAQDVMEVLPEAVTEADDKDKILTISGAAINALLVEALKDVIARLEALEARAV